MSRPTYTVKETYTGTGVLAEYTFSFKIESTSHLLVIEVDALGDERLRVRGNDSLYVAGVDGDGEPILLNYLTTIEFDAINGGGTITLSSPLASGHKLIILLANDAPTQDFEFRNKTSFTLRRFENALDAILGAVQRLTYRAKQAFRIHDLDDENEFNPQLPPGISDPQNANRLIVINPTATGITYGPLLEDLAGASGETGLPEGGLEGDFIQQTTDGEGEWINGSYEGFSARFNEAFSSTSLDDTIRKILNFAYLAPLISLGASGSGTVREKGTVVASTLLTATTTKRTDPILTLEFRQGTTSLLLEDPAVNPNGGSSSHTYATSFSDNISFNARAFDGTTTVTSNTVNFTFVYPYFHGTGAPGRTAAQVAAMTKSVITSNANLNRSFTPSDGDVYYFAYPAAYGALTSILDENGFETIADWTLRTENITGLDTTSQSYRIYEFNNPVVAGSTNYTFKR